MPIHNFIGFQTTSAISEFCPEDFLAIYEQSMLLNIRNEFVPDVMILRAEGANRTPVFASDVLLVVEILSKSSKGTDRRLKRDRYEAMGIPGYWIIDPLSERVTLTELRLCPDGYQQRLQTDELVTLDEPWKITLDLPAWTRRRDHIRAVSRP